MEGELDDLINSARQERDKTFVYMAVVHTPGACSTHTLVTRKGGHDNIDMFDELRKTVVHEFCAEYWELAGSSLEDYTSADEALKALPATDVFEMFFENGDCYCDMHSFSLRALGYGPLVTADYVSRMPDTPAANEVMASAFWPMLAQLLAQPEATPEYNMGQRVLADLMEVCRPR